MNQDNKRFILVLVGIILLAGVISLAILRDRIVNRQFRTVTVSGQGKVSYNPDLAIVTLGVQIDKAAKPEEALNQLNTKVAAIVKAVSGKGVEAKDIQTQNYNLYPQYDYRDNVQSVSGYSANQQLVITVRGYDKDQNKLSGIIAAASQAGANQISSLSFDASNMEELKQQARVLALSDARAKSEDLAKAADVSLDEVAGWYENTMSPVPYYNYGGADGKGGAVGAQSSPVTPSGSREVIVEIGLSYNLK